MRRFAAFALFATFSPVAAQTPPMPLPPTVLAKRETPAKLPNAEKLRTIDPKSLTVKRLNGAWQIWANDAVFKSFGDNVDDANDVARTLRELYPQRWGVIGTDRPVVEYGLTLDNEQKLAATTAGGFARSLVPMDPKTLRVEQVKGVWCLRDDANLFLNFGRHRADAELALAVAQGYGYTRLGVVGRKEAALTFFTGSPEGLPRQQPSKLPPSISFQMQADAMTRTGIPLPVYGHLGERKRVDPAKAEYVGEMVAIDSRKVELRTEGREIVLASGREELARFAANDDFTAREAQRAVRDARLTEFCRFGASGVTFFLSNGQAPRNLPLSAQGPRFDPASLRVYELRGRWNVADATGKPIATVASREEAVSLVGVFKAFGFDQICVFASAGKPAMTVFAKAR